MSERDIVERLRELAQEPTEKTMKAWDNWRGLHANGFGGDATRLDFEGMWDFAAEIGRDGAAEIERLRAAIATARNDALEKAALCLPRYEHSRDDLAQIISDMQDRIRSLKSKGAGDEH